MTKEQVLISVVMPCYNVAAYVGCAIKSLQAQTHLAWELVAVDDCSTDETLDILRRAAKDDERVRVVALSENGGASCARNAGVAAARGTHIAFLDPDDSYDEELFAKLNDALDEGDFQVIVWGALEQYFDADGAITMEKAMVCESRACLEASEVHNAVFDLEQRTLFGYAWNKLYRRDALEKSGALFPVAAINEDVFFNIAIAPYVESLKIIGEPLYRYAKRTVKQRTSLTGRYLPDYFELSVRRVQGLLDLCHAWGDVPGAKTVLGTVYVRYALSALQRNCDPRSDMTSADRRRWLDELYASEIAQELIPFAEPEGKAAKFFAGLFKRGSRIQLLFWARVIYLVNRYASGLFARLKQSR